ncbi:hypothetical protein MMC20_002999 [Loxospora ochrophaea]|nr:hypothetical protein [Loxospora ochrophaea]
MHFISVFALTFCTLAFSLAVRSSGSSNAFAPISYTIDITNTDGNDAAHQVAVLGSSNASNPLQKRGACLSSDTVSEIGSNRRPIIQCNRYYPDFHDSWCEPWTGNPRAYAIRCINHIQYGLLESMTTINGACNSNEYCLDVVRNPYLEDESIAYCVSTDKFMKTYREQGASIKKRPHGPGPSQQQQQPQYNEVPGKGICTIPEEEETSIGPNDVLAIQLAGNDPATILNANHLQLEAQSINELFNAISYTTLPGGVKACSDCSSISIQPVPAATLNIHISLILPVGATGTIYTMWFSP